MVTSFLYFLFILVALLLAEELFRHYPKFALAVFLFVPVLLIPYWRLSGVSGWFPWVKGFSVMAGIVLIVLFRITKLERTKIGRWSIYLFLIVNILEAVTKDAMAGAYANYLNALAGILLVATLSGPDSIHIDVKERYKDIHWGEMTVPWIVGYTLWNLVFIYLNYTPSLIHHSAVLASALVVALIDKERWLQTRAITLGTYFILSISILHSDAGLFSSAYNDIVALWASLTAFGFMALFAGYGIMANRGRGYL